jgi:hypothetical protein
VIQTILLFTLRPGVTDEQQALRAALATMRLQGLTTCAWAGTSGPG